MTAVAPIDLPTGRIRIKNNWNKEYREMFKGKEIVIPAGGTVEMEYFEGVAFLGQYVAPMKNDSGEYIRCKPLTGEKIFINEGWIPSTFTSHADGKIFTTQVELDAHLKTLEEKGFVPRVEKDLDKLIAAEGAKTEKVLDKLATAVEAIAERLERLESKGKKKRDTSRNNDSGETGQ